MAEITLAVGSLKTITSTNDTTINFTIIGGGGGRGGNDSDPGSSGVSGTLISGSFLLKTNEVLYAAPGYGGGHGQSSTPSAIGGAGGRGIERLAGGTGGKAGPIPRSGGGGGGGAASALWVLNTSTNSTRWIAVAGGGGGGGGGGKDSAGVLYSRTPYMAANTSFYYPSYGPYTYWSEFQNTYNVWIGGTTLNSDVYHTYFFRAPYSGSYTVTFAADNSGSFLIDNVNIISSTREDQSYKTPKSVSTSISAGDHTITLIGSNYTGAAGVAAALYNSSGTMLWNSRYSRIPDYYGTRGGNGQDHRSDGGGGGGGGGGVIGGAGGIVPRGDDGGRSGSSGYTYASASDVTYNSIIYDPTNSQTGGYGLGSTTLNVDGGDGVIKIASTSINKISIKDSSVMKSPSIYYRMDNSWKPVKEVYYRSNDSWLLMYGDQDVSVATSSQFVYNSDPNPPPFYDYVAPTDVVTGTLGTTTTTLVDSNLVTYSITAGSSGCPAPWHNILLSDGSLIEAGALQVGMMLRTRHQDTFEWGDYAVSAVELQEQERIEIVFDHCKFTCSTSHMFYTKDSSWKNAIDLSVGDVVDGHVVLSINNIDAGIVVKLMVDEAHTYVCEGMLSHNEKMIYQYHWDTGYRILNN